jgi:hypothetical protein
MNKSVVWQTEVGVKDENVSCNYLTYMAPEKYTWDMNFISTAEAQSTVSAQSLGTLATTDNLLSIPLYITIIIFLLFTVTMSLTYMYHWVKFNLNDPFIKNFSIIYFIGLCLLLIPLIFNLLT